MFPSWPVPRNFQQLPGRRIWRGFVSILLVCLFWGISANPLLADETPNRPTTSIQPYLERVMDEVSQFRLKNGMQFIVLENHRAPVVSFLIYADVGGANEPDGQTGVAHYLEHLAFKGTKRIGTTNYQQEKPLLDRLDQLFAQIKAAEKQGKSEQVSELFEEFEAVQAKASKFIKPNEFSQIVEQAGGVGLNAATSTDSTVYFYSLPSNKLELWMSLESERFLEPVFREFFKEKQVILEERRLRTENSPVGQMIENFTAKAFQVHPYRRPVIGSFEDIQNLDRDNVKEFFKAYYVPNNLTVAIVGDVDPNQVKDFAQTYFGRYQASPEPPKLDIVEPPQQETRELTMKLKSQPWYFEGYHRPEVAHPDHVIYQAISSILSSGRTSRLYRTLVQEQQVALAAEGFSGYPGDKYPNLMLFYALTAPGHSVEEVAAALRNQIERLKTEPVSSEELERVKTQAKAGLLRSLDSNIGMAFALLEYEIKTGNWMNLFKQMDAIAEITPADIQRVAQKTFRPENRTIGKLLSEDS